MRPKTKKEHDTKRNSECEAFSAKVNRKIHPERALKLKELKDSGKITMMFYEMLDNCRGEGNV